MIDVTPYPETAYPVGMNDTTAPTLLRAWRRYRRTFAELDLIRAELDDLIEQSLGPQGLRQADVARLLGATRQDIQESVRRQKRRKRGKVQDPDTLGPVVRVREIGGDDDDDPTA
jgi:uncharacterized protein YjiS (DUF1127 family)